MALKNYKDMNYLNYTNFTSTEETKTEDILTFTAENYVQSEIFILLTS